MITPRPFLNTADGAYLAREVPPPDDELTRVGPGTPCGEDFRRGVLHVRRAARLSLDTTTHVAEHV